MMQMNTVFQNGALGYSATGKKMTTKMEVPENEVRKMAEREQNDDDDNDDDDGMQAMVATVETHTKWPQY
jgi:hypothetical protein